MKKLLSENCWPRPSLTNRSLYPTALLVILIVAALAFPPTSRGQLRRDGFRGFGNRTRQSGPRPLPSNPFGEFTFVRTIYNSPYSSYGGYERWMTDYPEADEHLITGIREWVGTNLNLSSEPQQLPMTDDRIYDYPLLYIVEPGYMEVSTEEAKRLREYLTRGGFLFLDDFHGEREWQNVQEQLQKVFPEYQIKDLPLTHPIFHSYLDINEVIQVPGVYSLFRGVTYEKGGITPHYMGIEDKNGRLVVFITRNCDFGDAWEWINDSRYPVRFGLAAYKLGINVIIYAMSH
jgi:hypothetical protein